MLNAERFKEEILKNSNVVFDFSMSKDKHTIKKCLGTCDDCFFHEVGDHCSNIKVKWLLSEYKEPVKLSRLEYEILKWEKKEGYKYIARTSSNSLFFYANKPNKLNYCWVSKDNNDEFFGMFNKLFQFIQWEDAEPTSIQEVLENCEVVNDAEE